MKENAAHDDCFAIERNLLSSQKNSPGPRKGNYI